MSKYGIDESLKILSAELINGYEVRNLGGKTLQEVNEEYKAAIQNTGMEDLVDWIKLVMFSTVVGSILYIYLLFWKGVPLHIALTAMSVLPVSTALYLVFPLKWKILKNRETRYRCEPILRDFKQAVEALNPLETSKKSSYTSGSVWGTLLLIKVQVLQANSDFLSACKAEEPSKIDIKKIIEWGEHCTFQFDSVFDASEKFGLDFSKSRLYTSAKEKIAENAYWHS